MNPRRLICLTRLSIGSLGLTDPAARIALAREVRRLRRNQETLWRLHGYPRHFRVFS